MTPPRPPSAESQPPYWARIKATFEALAELPPAARAAALETQQAQAAAHPDGPLPPEALAELHSLLRSHDGAQLAEGRFLHEPAAAALARDASASPPDAAAAAVPSLQAGTRLGPWEIVRPLGRGGMGEVFEARRADGSFEGRAAIKQMQRGMASAAVLARFAQERQALAKLSHPHIARLFDAGLNAEGLPYFVMELVEGEPLDRAAAPLGLRQRLALFLQLTDAVAHAHRKLLVHRDLKPSNVLVTADGQVKLLDFGIAQALDAAASPGNPPGTPADAAPAFTPHYASPEQVRGEAVSTATDIYSLGVLLYQLLTGSRPTGQQARTPAEVARSVLEETPTRPSQRQAAENTALPAAATRRQLEGDLDHVLLKALEKDTEQRYPSVDALAGDLRAYLQGLPVAAHPPHWGYRAGKFVRRHALAVALGSSVLLALSAGLAGTYWQWQRAESARAAQAQRFAQVRAQANRLLFDYHDRILALPGSTAVVQQLLEDARQHLHSLAQDAERDVGGDVQGKAELLRELGVAQRRLGELYASPGRAALGDTGTSLALLQEAVARLNRALALQPASSEGRYQLGVAQAALASRLREQGKGQEALALIEQAGAHFEALATEAPREGRYRIEQVRTQQRLVTVYSSTQGGLGKADLAEAALARAGALIEPLRADFPDDLDAAALYATVQNLRYLADAREGRWAQGLERLNALQPVFAQLVERAPHNTLMRRDAAVNELSRGTALGQLGRWAEAREASAGGLARMQALVEADPANRTARRDAAKLQTDVGVASLRLGDLARARRELQAASTALQSLASADAKDRRVSSLLVAAQLAQAEAVTRDPALSAAAKPKALKPLLDAATARAAALVAESASDAGALRTLASAHQQAGERWLALRPPQTLAACRHLRESQAVWDQLAASQRLRKADAPQRAAVQRALDSLRPRGAAAGPGLKGC